MATLAVPDSTTQAANGTSAATSSDPPPPPAPSDRTVTFADSAAPGTAAATTTSTTATSTTSGGAGGGAGAGASPSATAALPKLPLPSLEETCKNLVPAITTLLNDSEREELEKDIKAMLEPDSSARKLHSVLEDRAKCSLNWLEEWWYDSYLKCRAPLPTNIAPFFILEDDPTPSRNSQSARATSLILSTLKFYTMLRAGHLPVDSFKGVPLCMLQYERLFHSSRIPGIGRDETITFDPSQHIVVMSRGQIYWFNVLTPAGQMCLTSDEIAENLRAIREDSLDASASQAVQQAVGVLTGENRNDWAVARNRLMAVSDNNRQSLEVIDTALFVVCLDNHAPSSLSDQCANSLAGTSKIKGGVQIGTCLNRWYDKSLQIVVCANGSAGVVFEHSKLDGHTVLRMASDVFTDTILRFAQTIHKELPSVLDGVKLAVERVTDPTPKKIVWELTPDLQHAIRKGESMLSDLNEIVGLEFGSYGKRFIVSHKLSPDALVQLAYQIAYYNLYGEFQNTYETVMTKQYAHGRTEACRPASAEAMACAMVFDSAASAQSKVDAIRRAIAVQVAQVKRCVKGKGVDRHLMGLQWAAQEKGLPQLEFFNHAAWNKLSLNVISTSNCGNPSLRLFGFGPVCPQGFGIGYIIKDDGIQFAISSHNRQTKRFVDTLERVLNDIRSLLESTNSASWSRTTVPAGSISLSARRPMAPSAGISIKTPRYSYQSHAGRSARAGSLASTGRSGSYTFPQSSKTPRPST